MIELILKISVFVLGISLVWFSFLVLPFLQDSEKRMKEVFEEDNGNFGMYDGDSK